jgi:hypothetical protein
VIRGARKPLTSGPIAAVPYRVALPLPIVLPVPGPAESVFSLIHGSPMSATVESTAGASGSRIVGGTASRGSIF